MNKLTHNKSLEPTAAPLSGCSAAPENLSMIGTEMKLAFAVIFAVMVGCSPRPNNLVYVFPDDFHGTFIFRGDSPKGIPVRRVKNELRLKIPPSGVLEIRGELPIRDWNIVSGRFENRELIPVYDPGANLAKDTIALRPVGSTNKNEEWFVVGTYEGAAQAHEKLYGFKWNSK